MHAVRTWHRLGGGQRFSDYVRALRSRLLQQRERISLYPMPRWLVIAGGISQQ